MAKEKMTNEEMAYEYAKYDDNGRVSVNDDKFKAFLAGLETEHRKHRKQRKIKQIPELNRG